MPSVAALAGFRTSGHLHFPRASDATAKILSVKTVFLLGVARFGLGPPLGRADAASGTLAPFGWLIANSRRSVVNQLLSDRYLFASWLLLEEDAFKLVHQIGFARW